MSLIRVINKRTLFWLLREFTFKDTPRAIKATAVADDAIKVMVVSIAVNSSIFKNENKNAKMTESIKGL